LASPVTVNPDNAWMTNFMTQALARGYRMDAIAAHSYPSPNNGSSDALVNLLQGFQNDWDRPVWLSEFSTVNWSGTGTWTEEDNYNWLAEFMWRAESLPWLRHYSLFIFSANTNYPSPANPWDPVGPRSNAYQTNGTTPTAFGELYFAWDGDATVRENKAYFIHNQGERKRLRNAVGSSAPSERWIRDGGDTVQWVLRPSGTAGQWYITSLRDGRRLRYTGGTLDFAPAHTTGTAVRWSRVAEQHGWFYIENPAAGAANRRLKLNNAVFSMVSNTDTTDQSKWRFIVPFSPEDTAAPDAPLLTASPGDTRVVLTWTASTNPDFSFYSLYRSSNSGGPYGLLASNLTATMVTNSSLQNGTTYFYVVTATDEVGLESTDSNQAAAQPVAALPPASLDISSTNGALSVAWPSSHLGWQLQTQTNSLASNGWFTIPNSTTSNWMSWPINPGATSIFFRVKHP
jgi:Glycosyl hydrolase catalytic core